MSDDVFMDIAHRGAELMDEMHPGWRDRVDVESLDIANGNTCIIGQCFRDQVEYEGWSETVTDVTGLPFYRLPDHGFVLQGGPGEDLLGKYTKLTHAWREVIESG